MQEVRVHRVDVGGVHGRGAVARELGGHDVLDGQDDDVVCERVRGVRERGEGGLDLGFPGGEAAGVGVAQVPEAGAHD